MAAPHEVVIIGGGFAGLSAARALRRAPAHVTLIDRRNFHLFQPLLYQVATGGLSPANIAAPLRRVFARQRNVTVRLGEVFRIDPQQRSVHIRPPEHGPAAQVRYDTLIVATGATHNYFGHDEWAEWAPGLKSIEDATAIRRRILLAFESAEAAALSESTGAEPAAPSAASSRSNSPSAQSAWMTFVVVGAGPTGVELAGTLAEIARQTLRQDFRGIDPAGARILLVDAAERVLTSYPPELSQRARATLEGLGVTVRTDTMVEQVGPGFVMLRSGQERSRVEARTILWAAGVQASPLGRMLHETCGAKLDRAGRVLVEPDLSVSAANPEILVLGDLAAFLHQGGKPLPGTAPVAMQQGRYAAKCIRARLRGRKAGPFQYWDKGQMATIGRAAAVAEIGRLRFGGYPAWLIWLFIHLMYLVEFENRVLVLLQWAWNYVTFGRSARLITQSGDHSPPRDSRDA